MRRSIVAATLMVTALIPFALAQEEEAPERRLAPAEILDLRAQAQNNTELAEEPRARALELYDAALKSLEAAAGFERSRVAHERERAGVGRMVEELRASLAAPGPEPRLRLPEDATMDQAESALARERSRLAAHRSSLRDLEALSEERNAQRTQISKRLGKIDQQVESLADELRDIDQREVVAEVKEAARKDALARREAAQWEAEALRAQMDLLSARGALLPSRIDQAQRRISYGEALVELLDDATVRLRRQDAVRSLEIVREQSRQAAELSEALAAAAGEIEELAAMLWGVDGVISRSEETARLTAQTGKNISDLDRITQLMRRQFAAYGHRGAITRWWPKIPEGFPEPGDTAARVRLMKRRIPEAQHELIRLEQLRTGARSRADHLLDQLEGVDGEPPEQEVQRAALQLVSNRRDILDELIQAYGRYSNQLVTLETRSRFFLTEQNRVQDFLYENLLWVRSVPKPIVPRVGDLGRALSWILSPANWAETLRTLWASIRSTPGLALMFVAGVVLLQLSRGWMFRRMRSLATLVKEDDAVRLTLEAMLYVVLRAAPLPAAMFVASLALRRSDVSAFGYAAGEALYYLAGVAALLELFRVALSRYGLAENHFPWPRQIARPVQRGLILTEAVVLPLLFVSLHLAFAGMRLISPEELQAHNNSLGRTAFILGLIFFAAAFLVLFRPKLHGEMSEGDDIPFWSRPLYYYAYPPILLATVVPAAMAALGYYITGLLLGYQMLRTLWLCVALLALAGVLFRWRKADEARKSRPGGPAETADRELAQTQVHGLLRFAFLVVAAFGIWGIWSDAVPTLRILEKVQLWPRIELLETSENEEVVAAASTEPAPDTGAETPATTATPPGLPLPATPQPAAAAETASALTLWKLLQALLAAAITFMLAKNLPGLVELVLRTRSGLDAGARIAVSTLVRYTILIIGTVAVFGLLGLSWSRVQWLAAALTFGLAFGLQEIVANFVSGLILLLERPVRVGDAVTVGNLQGIVSRIQIRATTITLWDRSEMIVPNKEFITTKLVNWTLSDSKRRLEIPIRIAYGADLERVRKTLVEVAKSNPQVITDPKPHVLLIEFGDDAIKFELRVFVEFGISLSTRDQLQMAIDKAFEEQGIDFALPQLKLHVPPGPSSRPAPSGSST